MVAVKFSFHSALAIKFIQLQASPIVMSPQYLKDRSQGERTTVHTHSWVTMHALHVKWYKIPYIHACVLFACTSSHSFFYASAIQHVHDIPLGSSVISAVPTSLGSTFSQSDSGVLSDALMAAELSSYFCLLVAWFSSWFSASQQINSCVVAVKYRGLYLRVGLVYRGLFFSGLLTAHSYSFVLVLLLKVFRSSVGSIKHYEFYKTLMTC